MLILLLLLLLLLLLSHQKVPCVMVLTRLEVPKGLQLEVCPKLPAVITKKSFDSKVCKHAIYGRAE